MGLNIEHFKPSVTSFILSLSQVSELQEFREVIVNDAHEIQGRQETDSISIVDDIRFHITNFVQTFSEMQEADEQLKIIDDVLEELNLEG